MHHCPVMVAAMIPRKAVAVSGLAAVVVVVAGPSAVAVEGVEGVAAGQNREVGMDAATMILNQRTWSLLVAALSTVADDGNSAPTDLTRPVLMFAEVYSI